MKDIYIFSQKEFAIKYNNIQYPINKNSYVKIDNADFNENLIIQNKNNNEEIAINLRTLRANNYYRVFYVDNIFYIEIITTSFKNLKNKFTTKNAEVYVYEKSLRLIKDSRCYTYYFDAQEENYCIEQNECLYIFNNKYLIIFNLKNNTFNCLFIKEYNKIGNKIEFLCQILRNFAYFLHFSINLSNNSLQIKKFKKGENNTILQSKIYQFFYLSKFNFADAKNYLNNEKNTEKISQYFNLYENIIEINNQFYLYNSLQFTKLNFTLLNDKIEDID